MIKKPYHKKVSNIEISQELNALLKKYKIDKTEYIKPFSVDLYYNPDNVIKGKNKINDLICPICYNILKNPISCNSTKKSHSFCEECINKSIEINDKCPMCKQEFEFGINKKVEKLLQKLKFKCIYAEEGCPKILDYSIYFKHIDKCGFRGILYECQIDKYYYAEKKFKKCKYIGTLKKLNKHFIKCAFSEYKCVFCNKNIIQANIRKHYESECKILIVDEGNMTYIGQHNDEYQKEGYGLLYLKSGLFKGEFHNGKANGYGLLKNTEGTSMEGEWTYSSEIDGLILDGYGIINNELGELVYKGQIKKANENGIGIEFLNDGYYEGEFKDGNKEGYGIFHPYNHDQIERYECEYKNNLCEGYGIVYYKDGGKFIGVFKNDLPNGFGLEIDSKFNIIYKGLYNDGFYNGYGILNNYGDEIYKGEFIKEDFEGYGIYYYSNGDIYEGEWKKSVKNGWGFFYKSKVEKFIQYWMDDKLFFEEKL